MSGAISATDGSLIITMEYNPAEFEGKAAGLGWVIVHDNPVLGWTTAPPVQPLIIGTMPGAAPATDPVLSPTWAQYMNGTVFVPDMWRGGIMELFQHLATNNDAQRKVYAKFSDASLASAWSQWSQGNPLALTEPPNVTAARVADEAKAEAEAKKAEAEAKAAEAKDAKTAADEAKAAADSARRTGAPRADKS